MMENDTNKNLIRLVAVIFVSVLLGIAGVFFLIGWMDRKNDVSVKPEGNAYTVSITANPGGGIPTQVPTDVPAPVEGMDSPMLCKMELAALHAEAEKIGAGGILTLDSYDFGKKACIFDIKNISAFGSVGKIEAFSEEKTEGYGIRLKIDQNRTEDLQKWGEAALQFFNSSITPENAEGSIRTALSEGTAESDIYSIKVYDDFSFIENKAKPIRVIEIRTVEEAAEN